MRAVLLTILLTVVAAGGCGGGDANSASDSRPTTRARLQFVEPTPAQVTGPDVAVKLNLTGARVVKRTTQKLRADEGHIHLSVDGKLVSMAYGTTQDLRSLKPGPHALRAEFVAGDHRPFRNRVVAAVLFTVQR